MFLPEGVDASTIQFLKREGAEIVTAGRIYLEALRAAEKAVAVDPNAYGRTTCSPRTQLTSVHKIVSWSLLTTTHSYGQAIVRSSRSLPGSYPDKSSRTPYSAVLAALDSAPA